MLHNIVKQESMQAFSVNDESSTWMWESLKQGHHLVAIGNEPEDDADGLPRLQT